MVALLERKRLTEAKELFQRMEMDKITPDAIAVSALIAGLAKSGDVNEAEKLCETAAKQYGLVPSLHALTALITAFAGRVCFYYCYILIYLHL